MRKVVNPRGLVEKLFYSILIISWLASCSIHYFEKSEGLVQVPDERKSGRFVIAGKTAKDTKTGLEWLIEDPTPPLSQKMYKYDEAQRLIMGLNASNYLGHNDWRLPTVEDWKTLIDQSNENPALVYPNPFKYLINNIQYWTGDGYDFGAGLMCPVYADVVFTWGGNIVHQKKDDRALFFVVRTAKPEKYEEYKEKQKALRKIIERIRAKKKQ